MGCRIFGCRKTTFALYKIYEDNINNLYSLLKRNIYSKVEVVDENVSNVEILVPWGKIAGKLWGNDKSKQPILALHGWQDNAATFDNLAPLLIKHGPILAIDLPGHGLSSWLPPGQVYFEYNYVLLIHRLKRLFAWEKVKLLAHSFSNHFCFWYASMYPKDIAYMIAIDHLKPPSRTIEQYNNNLAKAFTKICEIEEIENKPRCYKKEELVKIWLKNTLGSITEDSCKILMTRGVTENPDGTVYLNRDPRLRILMSYSSMTHDQLKNMARSIICPYLFIKSDFKLYIEDKKLLFDVFDILKESSIDCQYHVIPHTHHIHLNDPQLLIQAIDPFLEKYN
ncbi:hypothetical protein M0802_001419 [Mischocyttarus mexicanus]|nr:hypothetical protein M0802_001419 [Mischocyttarus mexicanus]